MSKRKSLLYILISYIIALVIGYLSFNYLFMHIPNVLYATLLANIITTIIIFISSVTVNNSSVYDPYWSLIPPFIYILWIHVMNVELTVPIIIIGIAIFTWSVRLTLNWIINWDGLDHEDWRYRGFRKKTGKWYWIVSFLAIHLFPTVMVYLGMLPIYYGIQASSFNSLLFVGFIVSIGSVFITFLADKDLTIHRHSNESHKSISRGIWRFSRHPNYLGEILFWLGCFLMGVAGSDKMFTMIGFIAMLILFEGYSIPAMEKRLSERKSDYKEIQKKVPRLFPLPIKKIFK